MLLLAGCAHAKSNTPAAKFNGPKPDWVDGSSMEYPRAGYLTGVGQGMDRKTAEDQARAEISKIFSSQITVKTNVSATETDTNKSGKVTNSFKQSVTDDVQNISNQTLQGVDVPETWTDPATSIIYVLAVLDRQKAIGSVTDKLADFDKQSQQWNDQMSKATDKLPRVKAALKLLEIIKAREGVADELRVLDPSGKAPAAALDEATVRPIASKAISDLNVVVSMSGDGATQIKTGIIKGLNSFGLQAKSDASAGADILVESSLEANQQAAGKFQRANGTVTVSLKDGHTSAVFSQFDVTDRQDSVDYNVALNRLQASLAKKVSTQISDAVTSYFENQ
jgi:hypothetical protein